jgi:transcriptional regulator with XRE-family HTH domain
LAKTLKQIITETGLKQYVIAHRADISENFLSRMITGDRRPSPQTAKKLAKVLNCGVEDIFFAINKHGVDN